MRRTSRDRYMVLPQLQIYKKITEHDTVTVANDLSARHVFGAIVGLVGTAPRVPVDYRPRWLAFDPSKSQWSVGDARCGLSRAGPGEWLSNSRSSTYHALMR